MSRRRIARVSLHTVRVDAFGTVVIVLALVAVVVAAASYWGSGSIYGGLGKGGLGMDHDERRPTGAAGPQSAEAQEEIRQMLEAKSARREARGEAPLDVESELASLTRAEPAADPALREEVGRWSWHATSGARGRARSRLTWRLRSSGNCAI